jgi:hypothetical protein
MLIRHKHREGAAMKYFAGLDVSLEETAICVVEESGRIVKETRAASEPEALIKALRKVGLRLERIGLEACSLSSERAMPGSFRGDDGRGDLVECPEPAEPRFARS